MPQQILTACTLDCPDACSIILDYGGKKLKIRGNPRHPITRGFTCSKIKNFPQRLNNKSRITSPLLKNGGQWEKISWNHALSICCRKLEKVLADDPRKILHIQGHGARGVSKEVADAFFTRLGCTKTHGSLCDLTGIQASINDFGALDHNSILDLPRSRYIVNWGKDFSRSSIHLAHLVQQARKKQTRVISIWPGGEGFERFADGLVCIKPGCDRFLALGIAKRLWEQGLLHPEYMESCRNKDEYLQLLRQWPLSRLAADSGTSSEIIDELAQIYARQGVSTVIGWGLQRHALGLENVRHINALAWLSGNVGSRESGVYYNISSLRNLNLSWLQGQSSRSFLLPALGNEISAYRHPSTEMAWISGCNIVNQAPHSKYLAKVLQGLKFVVVVDAFLNDTAACADLILPCTLMWEEEDILGSCMHDYIQAAAKAFDPPPECRSDFWITRQINQLLQTGYPFPSRREAFQMSLAAPHPDLNLAELQREGFAWAGKNEPAFARETAHKHGGFCLTRTLTPESGPDPSYPLRLLSLVHKHHIHSQILPEEQNGALTIYIHPDSPVLQEVDLQKDTFLASPEGRLQVRVCFDSSLHPETIICRRGYWMRYEKGINSIIQPHLTDAGIAAAYYAQQVRLEN